MEQKTRHIGEFELIDRIKTAFPQAPEGVVGIGDDCAVIPQCDGWETVVSTDMLVEGSHFLLERITPYQLGWKAAASNFSDIAAMGAEPVGSFLALALPKDADLPGVEDDFDKVSGVGSSAWIDEFIRGYRDISVRYGFPLLGGDTTASKDGMSICVTVTGRVRKGTSRLRSMAQPGDYLCVTGSLGDSAAGLDIVMNGAPGGCDADYLLGRHYLPTPRVREGLIIGATPGVHAMMDISDGIASDLGHMLRASGAAAEIDCAALPLSGQLLAAYPDRAVEFALCGGEDYELLFTASKEAVSLLQEKFSSGAGTTAEHRGCGVTVIGRITEHPSDCGSECGGIKYIGLPKGLDPKKLRGYDHFKE